MIAVIAGASWNVSGALRDLKNEVGDNYDLATETKESVDALIFEIDGKYVETKLLEIWVQRWQELNRGKDIEVPTWK